jgi:hypothetical protein
MSAKQHKDDDGGEAGQHEDRDDRDEGGAHAEQQHLGGWVATDVWGG